MAASRGIIHAFGIASLVALLASCGGNRIETGGSVPSSDPSQSSGEKTVYASEPQFKKEGVLVVRSANGDSLARIDIEIAATDAEREQGLMYRTSIADNTGMLFLFDAAEMQSFWMKNTPSSLDIMFIGPDDRILNLYAFTSPYSVEGLPSKGPCNKVLEVMGGYCAKHSIVAGCKIAYKVTVKNM
jgi:uncharacterized protein